MPTATASEPGRDATTKRPEMSGCERCSWTPDSRYLIYARSVAGEKGKFEFWRISAEGGEPENLGLMMEGLLPYGLSVHPDGKCIAFTAGTERSTEVWVLKDFLPAPKTTK